MIHTILSSLAIFTAVLGAQSHRIVPQDVADIDGNWASFLPFAHAVTRTQQVFTGTAISPVGAQLTCIAWRVETRLDVPPIAFVMSGLTVSMGHTAVTPQTMSKTFANNVTGPMGVVFRGNLNVASPPPALGIVGIRLG